MLEKCWKNVASVGKLVLQHVGEMSGTCCKKNWRVIYVGRMLEKCWENVASVYRGKLVIQYFYDISPTFSDIM